MCHKREMRASSVETYNLVRDSLFSFVKVSFETQYALERDAVGFFRWSPLFDSETATSRVDYSGTQIVAIWHNFPDYCVSG